MWGAKKGKVKLFIYILHGHIDRKVAHKGCDQNKNKCPRDIGKAEKHGKKRANTETTEEDWAVPNWFTRGFIIPVWVIFFIIHHSSFIIPNLTTDH